MNPGAQPGQEDYYRILGISRDAGQEDVERAYFDLARRLHPDVAGGGPEATARFMLINEAYQTLISPLLRREYDKNLGIPVSEQTFHSGPTGTAVKTGPATAARKQDDPRAGAAQRLDDAVKKAIRIADRLCEQGNFWQANDMLMRMLVRYPRQPALRRALARASTGMMRHREAADHLKVACEVEYFNAGNHLLLGEAYMKGKQWQKARDALRDALSWNEDEQKAKADLALIQKELEKSEPAIKRLLKKLSAPMGGGKASAGRNPAGKAAAGRKGPAGDGKRR
jgi:curved DNA-binding protein CbpA